MKMRPFHILLTLICYSGTFAQSSDITLGQLIAEINADSLYQVIYSPSRLDTTQQVSATTATLSLEALALELEAKYQINARIKGNHIILSRPQNLKHSISGYVMDAESGETLIGASIYCPSATAGTITNYYGFYSITLPEGKHQIICNYLGYAPETLEVQLNAPLKQDLKLSPASTALGPVIIEADNIESSERVAQTSTHFIDAQAIESAPILLGESDAIKSIQSLPGVKTVGEGSSSFFVRGGGLDQNLILLDEAPVYNPSHILGFFSVFNTDAIKNIEVYKGDIPAHEGGRLASLVDIRMKDGDNQKFGMTGGLSPISTKMTLEGPIKKGKSSYILSGRRTFLDLFYRLSSGDGDIWFYDVNGKVNAQLSGKDKVFFSFYHGKDLFELNPSYTIRWGNSTGTFRWNHIYSNKLFSTLSLVTSDYDYNIGIPLETQTDIAWNSGIRDYNAKLKFTHYLSPKFTLYYGLNSIVHQFDLGSNIASKDLQEWENAAFTSFNFQHHGWNVSAGLRASQAALYGPFTHFEMDDNEQIIDTVSYKSGEQVSSYGGLEPRFSASYTTPSSWKFSLSANRSRQYLQLLSNATGGFTSFDLWYPITKNTALQISDQLAVGIESPKSNAFQFTVEAYYKDMQNQLDYVDHAQIIENPSLEEYLRQGDGKSYGVEFGATYSYKKWKVNSSYTYSRSLRQIEGINAGEWYAATFDRPHDLKIQMQLQGIGQWDFMANWALASGRAVTLPIGFYKFDERTIPVYSERNGKRLPTFHRLDLSARFTPKGSLEKRWKGEWIFSVVNAYNHHNTYSINFGRAVTADGNIVDPKFDHVRTNAVSHTYLLGILPSITYQFKF